MTIAIFDPDPRTDKLRELQQQHDAAAAAYRAAIEQAVAPIATRTGLSVAQLDILHRAFQNNPQASTLAEVAEALLRSRK
jgi:transcriptional regulator with XRE-family HTH domain